MNVAGKWSLRQSNDATVWLDLKQFTLADGSEKVTGTAVHNSTHGSVDGNVLGDEFEFHVYWDGNVVGRYQASVNGSKRLLGTTYDVTKPNARASWLSDRQF
jgi:hypothetical protein